jgi:hypothetical protein
MCRDCSTKCHLEIWLLANMVNQISVCKVLQNVDLLSSEVKGWSHFMQDAVPHCGF